MKKISYTVAVALSLTGCANLERSRDLGNPSVPAAVTAAQVCSFCHGVTGNPASPNFPRLAGQTADYLTAQIGNFKSKTRTSPMSQHFMWGLAHGLSDAQVAGLADYFSKQTPLPSPAGDPTLMAEGKALFEQGIPDKEVPPCSACHGPKAEGMATFPRLGHQFAPYLVKQLHIFRDSEHHRPGTPMGPVSHGLNDHQIQAVAEYLQAIPE